MSRTIERTCEHCQKVFMARLSNIRMDWGKYCSRECYHADRITVKIRPCTCCGKEFRPQKSNAKYCSLECRQNHCRVTIPCIYCGKEFVKRKKDTRQQDFCSKECKSASVRVDCTCKQCGKEFTLTIGKINNGQKGVFCSNKCQGEWMSNNLTGENSTRWRGGTVRYYGPDWERQRDIARKRDNYTCQDCGITEKEFGKKLEVHHKKPFKSFGYIPIKNDNHKQANDLSNLITLCIPCHKRAEKLVIGYVLPG